MMILVEFYSSFPNISANTFFRCMGKPTLSEELIIKDHFKYFLILVYYKLIMQGAIKK